MRIADHDDPVMNVHDPAMRNGANSFTREWRVMEALTRAALRAARMQLRVWVMHGKLWLVRLIIITAAAVTALFLVIAGLIFIYVGCYHVLTDVFHLPTAYACLIFGGLHMLVVALVAATTMILVHRRKRPQ